MRTTFLTLLASALLLPGAFGQVTETTSFDGGNPHGFHFLLGGDVVENSGGNPGHYLHQSLYDTFAPSLTTGAAAGAPWTGDFRALGVTRISVDAITLGTQFGNDGFPFALILTDTHGTAGVDDDDFVYALFPQSPRMGDGWLHYDFAIPSADTSPLPAGWTGGHSGDPESFRPGVDWNDVITSVDEVEFYWLHPAWFAIFQQWDVGADNVEIEYTNPPVWSDLGFSTAGTHGDPELVASGDLSQGTNVTASLSNALENAPCALVAGFSAINQNFRGGVLVPNPQKVLHRTTSATGTVDITKPVPPTLGSGDSIFLQYWIVDAAGVAGHASSNALEGVAP